MTPLPKPTPGFSMVMTLLAGLLVIAGWMAWQRTVVVEDVGASTLAEKSADWPDMRLNLNTATAAELALLPGIGPLRAEAIVIDREINGPFQNVADVTRVKGIGRATLNQMAPYLVAEHVSVPASNSNQSE